MVCKVKLSESEKRCDNDPIAYEEDDEMLNFNKKSTGGVLLPAEISCDYDVRLALDMPFSYPYPQTLPALFWPLPWRRRA